MLFDNIFNEFFFLYILHKVIINQCDWHNLPRKLEMKIHYIYYLHSLYIHYNTKHEKTGKI